MTRPFVLAAALSLMAFAADARPPTTEEQDLLDTRMQAIVDATAAREFAMTVDEMPEALLSHFAGQAGVDTELFRTLMLQQIETVFADIAEIEVTFDSSALDIQGCDDGAEACTPYVFIPQVTSLVMNDGTAIDVIGSSFAFMDEERWYFLNTDPNLSALGEIYPFLADVDFPAADVRLAN